MSHGRGVGPQLAVLADCEDLFEHGRTSFWSEGSDQIARSQSLSRSQLCAEIDSCWLYSKDLAGLHHIIESVT